MPDPDLVIRTSGELRVSNFLLWQAAYAEFHFTPTLWPDFDDEDLREALEAYAGRRRQIRASVNALHLARPDCDSAAVFAVYAVVRRRLADDRGGRR